MIKAYSKIRDIGDVIVFRPENCPYLAVTQVCGSVRYGEFTQFYIVCYDYLLENEADFKPEQIQEKNILFIEQPPLAYKNIGNFPLHQKINAAVISERAAILKPKESLKIGDSTGGKLGFYFGYRSGGGYSIAPTQLLYFEENHAALILNNLSALYHSENIFGSNEHYKRSYEEIQERCGDIWKHFGGLSEPYSYGNKKQEEIFQAFCAPNCVLKGLPYLSDVCLDESNNGFCEQYPHFPKTKETVKLGDLFKIPLSNGTHCVGQLVYYDGIAGPIIGVFKGMEAKPEQLLTMVAIYPYHFYWGLWSVFDNQPPVLNYDFATAAANKWWEWKRYDSGYIQQFTEACHGLTKWQKGRFDELLVNEKLKPVDIEEIEIEFDEWGCNRKPLFIPPPEPEPNSTMLSPGRFWKIITESKEKAAGDSEKQMKILTEILMKADKEEIEKFNNRFYRCFFKAYTWELWGAAFVALGGCSDDAFMDFRGWLIAQGKEVFEAALKDPDSLADYAPLENPGIMEGFSYCASDAYLELGHGYLQYGIMPVFEPKGREWTEEELPELYPRLWEKFS